MEKPIKIGWFEGTHIFGNIFLWNRKNVQELGEKKTSPRNKQQLSYFWFNTYHGGFTLTSHLVNGQ